MKNILNFIKKNDTIICFVLFFIIILTILHNMVLTDFYDYIWNFQSTYKLYNGYTLYKDINAIVTPFSFYLGILFFKVLGANFLSFNIYGAVVNSMLVTSLYCLLKNLKCRRVFAIFITCGIYCLIGVTLIANGPNYNYIALMFVILGINLEVKENNKPSKYTNYMQGVISFLVLFTKQNIGVYYLVAITLYKIISKRKKAIKELVKQYSCTGILGFIYLMYLVITDTLNGFIYYVFSGVGDFTNNITFCTSYSFLVFVPIVITSLFLMGLVLKKYKDEKAKNIMLLLPMLIVSIGYIVPMVNDAHVMMMSVINLTILVYEVYVLLPIEKIHFIIRTILEVLMILTVIVLLTFSTVYFSSSFLKEECIRITDKNDVFYNLKIPKRTYREINAVTQYIKNKEKEDVNVIVIYQLSGRYMIPLKKNNGKFDCLNMGNLGKDAAQGVIEEIKQMKRTEILIMTFEQLTFNQQPKEVRKYIINNLKKGRRNRNVYNI